MEDFEQSDIKDLCVENRLQVDKSESRKDVEGSTKRCEREWRLIPKWWWWKRRGQIWDSTFFF